MQSIAKTCSTGESSQHCYARCIFRRTKSNWKFGAVFAATAGGASVKILWLSLRAILPGVLACLIFGIGVTAAHAQGQDRAPEYYQSDIQYGAQIFATQCTPCHGTSGDQIPGVNFRAGQFKRVVTDNDLRAT